MKRMTLIAGTLCLIMLTTVGAGAVAAQQKENPRHAGASSVYSFDVAATGTRSGKLMINLDEHKFIFNGKGFDAATTYYLRYRVGTLPSVHQFASITPTRSGNVHIEGTWVTDLAALPAAPTFSLGEQSTLVVAKLDVIQTGCGVNGATFGTVALHASQSTGPIVRGDYLWYRMHGTELTGGWGYTDPTGVPPIVQPPFKIACPGTTGDWHDVFVLTVYDSLGNTDAQTIVWT